MRISIQFKHPPGDHWWSRFMLRDMCETDHDFIWLRLWLSRHRLLLNVMYQALSNDVSPRRILFETSALHLCRRLDDWRNRKSSIKIVNPQTALQSQQPYCIYYNLKNY